MAHEPVAHTHAAQSSLRLAEPSHAYHHHRLLFWWAIAFPSTREWYVDPGRGGGEPRFHVCLACFFGGLCITLLSDLRTPCALPLRYEFINHKDSAYELGMFLKLGSFAWLVIALTALETLATIKFSRGLFTEPCPKIVLYAWGIGLGGMVVALLVWQVVLTMRARKRTVH